MDFQSVDSGLFAGTAVLRTPKMRFESPPDGLLPAGEGREDAMEMKMKLS